jgi:hypothetical protein
MAEWLDPNGIQFEIRSVRAGSATPEGILPVSFCMGWTRYAPLGAHINATSLEPIQQTQQWFKIDGDQLMPHDGYYDLRLTDE